jgi:transcriptional regulator with XRE-family HTH domain
MAIAPLTPFARLLRQLRLAAELTQEELAERAGLSARAISDLERAVKTRPHRVTVELLADALHLSPEDRTALLDAVPRGNGSPPEPAGALAGWLAAGGRPLPATVQPSCPRELRQVLEGLVGLYVDEERRDRQINITVIMFSVGEPVAGGQ